MWQDKAQQKLVSFSDSKSDIDRISCEMKAGWCIISLVVSNGCYVGIMEKTPNLPKSSQEDTPIHIPPRKKIKFLES
jgi:Protein of unknown function (DUF2674)